WSSDVCSSDLSCFGACRARSAAGMTDWGCTAWGCTACGSWDGGLVTGAGGGEAVEVGAGDQVLAAGAAEPATGVAEDAGALSVRSAGAASGSRVGLSSPTACLTRSTNAGWDSTTGGGGGGGGGGGSTTRSPDHPRKPW